MTKRTLWAIVRIDHFLEDLYQQGTKEENPARALMTVTKLHEREADAREHQATLSRSRDPNEIEYFVAAAEAAGEFGPSPVVFVGIRSFTPGGRVCPEQVIVGPVWPSREAAERAQADIEIPWQIDSGVVGSLQTARIRSSVAHATPPDVS